MGRNKSLPVRVEELEIASSITSAQTAAIANAVNLFTSAYQRDSSGNRTSVRAKLPEMENYDKYKMTFGLPTLGGTVTALVLTLYAWHPSGVKRVLGSSALNGSNQFPAIEFDATTESVELLVSTITGTSPAISALNVFIEGIHEVED